MSIKELLRGVGRDVSFDFQKSQMEPIISRNKWDLLTEDFRGILQNAQKEKCFKMTFEVLYEFFNSAGHSLIA